MIIRIVSIGKVKSSFIKAGEEEYLKRLRGSPFKIDQLELDAESSGENNRLGAQEKEAERLMGRLKADDFLIVLDEGGTEMTSTVLAQHLQAHMNQGRKSVHFAIGGAYGWAKSVYQRADLVLSLSQLTFPFQLTRLILIEQLYRSYSIIQGAPYHKA